MKRWILTPRLGYGPRGMDDMWLQRWKEGRIGWHEADGSALLKRHWPRLVRGSRVLVPFCGKSADMLWLAALGLDVTGIELSELAVRTFFDEHDMGFENSKIGGLTCYKSTSAPLRVLVGNYFDFEDAPFAALYDRGALVAVDAGRRDSYVEHTQRLLEADAYRMVITLAYAQERVAGPPFSVSEKELLGYWPDMRAAEIRNDIDTGPPKFREAGLTEVIETVWTSA